MNREARRVWTVSELATAIKNRLESGFPDLMVQGEVSALATPQSGHVYFTLKDQQAAIRCILYRHIRNYLRYLPELNKEILVRGKVSAYGARSEYQIVVDYLEPVGLGNLYAAFLQLQKQLAAKGYFEESRKRPLPFLPRKIGLVTSLSGAALYDMLRIILARRPGQPIVISPSLVQGEGAATSIAAAIKLLAEVAHPDLIIVGRGGGGPEDLWCWNEETVVEAVVKCPVPVISGVGHEVDVTLCDLAADKRAATPTHAAEIAVPKVKDLLVIIDGLHRRQAHAITRIKVMARERYSNLSRRLAHEAVPTALITRRLDDARETMIRAMRHKLDERRHRLELMAERHRAASPQMRMAAQNSRLALSTSRLIHAQTSLLRNYRQRLAGLSVKLEAIGPRSVLARGYSIVTGEDGRLIRRSADTHLAEPLNLRFYEGRVVAEVKKIDDI